MNSINYTFQNIFRINTSNFALDKSKVPNDESREMYQREGGWFIVLGNIIK